jgi:hypothetical protein
MTKKNINEVFNFLQGARMSRMKDDEKIQVIKLLRVMKPVAKDLQDAANDAAEKARAEYPDDMQKVIELVNKSMEDLASQEVIGVDTQVLTPDAFERLCLSNDWTFGQIDELEQILVNPAAD